MGRKIIQAVIIGLLFVAGCKTNENLPPQSPTTVSGEKIFVICEGNYGTGNAALSLYSPESGSVYPDVYISANGLSSNDHWGDVFQSMTRIGGHYFLCLNNSDKIAVIDTGSWHLVGNISILQPRFILPLSDSKAFVSTLYSNKVYVINPQNLQVTDTIMMPYKNAENMALVGSKAVICNWDTAAHSLTTIDPASNVLSASIPLPNVSPTDILQDKEGALWVLSGNVTKGRPAMITRIDAGSGAVLQNYPLPSTADPLRLCFNPTRDTLYWIEANYNGGTSDNGIYRMGIHENSLPATPIIPAQPLEYFWAVGIDPVTSNIYVGNPLGFTQQGSVQVYSPAGALLKTFKVGVGPGHFYFQQ